jgi:hypothetical protein
MKAWVVWAAVAAVVGTAVGYGLGIFAADKTKEDLGLIWADVMALPQDDRTLLVRLSIKCDLARHNKSRESIVACLRAAAVSADAEEPAGRAVWHLDELLSRPFSPGGV